MQIFQNALSAMHFTDFRVIVIGPPLMANLFGRSLAIFLPANLRRFVTYADIAIRDGSCSNATNETDFASLLVPLTSSDRV